ncbi:MAG: SurA N-terminal domain-containing protein [Sutterella wadsworthensis]|nr:SurA N-terminal domain-containing protein [Sutterella wadsworthensis]
MLQAFRDHKRWLMFIAMVLIIPSFVVTGIYSYNHMTQADNSIAKVGEVSITPEMFDRAKREQLERYRQQMGDQFRAGMLDTPEAREAILRMLMDDAAVSQMVAKEHVDVSEAQAVALIKNADALKKDGKFSPELYERFLQSQGKSDQQFVAEIRRDLSKETLLTGVTATYPVPPAVVEHLHKIITEQREVQTMVFNVDQYLGDVKVTPEEVRAYYDQHQKEFLAEEHLTAEYVVLSPDDFKAGIKPNEEEIRGYYEQNKNNFTTPEERRASHILIAFGDDKAASKKKAEDVLAKAKANPADFAKLATEFSSDPGSAAQGGDLDYFGRGMMVKPFEDATFTAKKGDIVGPVESDFGWHIIYVTDIRPSAVRPFEAVRSDIEAEYIGQMALREFSEKAEDFTNIVYEQADSLEPVAKKFGLTIHKADNVTRAGVTDEALKGLFNEHMIDNLYGDECLKEKRNSSAVEVGSNKLVAARVVKHFPTAVRPFDDVKAEIADGMKLRKAAELAKAAGEKKLAEVRASKSLDGFSAPVWVSRQRTLGHPAELVDRMVALPADKLPAYTGMAVEGGAYIIGFVKGTKVQTPKPEELKSLAREFATIYGEADRRGYLSALRTELGEEMLQPKFIEGESQPE